MKSENQFNRDLDLPTLLKKNSHFLFGPRATGKTHLIRSQLSQIATIVDLLKTSLYQRLRLNPSELEEVIDGDHRSHPERRRSKWIAIDEVQRIPELLNEVQRLIEERGFRFLLSGSSARKLKQQGVNLLGGRARWAELLPLTWVELGESFDLNKVLRWGTLPLVWKSNDPAEDLIAYNSIYLREEIQQEALVRNLDRFSDFLRLAAIQSGEILNYETVSREIGVSAPTVKEYYQILKDTLIAFEVAPYRATPSRKPVNTSKIFLFDLGVTNDLISLTALDRNTPLYGNRFEQWIAIELRAYLSYRRIREPLCFWRTYSQVEVDFVIGNQVAIEVKATKKVTSDHFKGLKALAEDQPKLQKLLVSQDPVTRVSEGVHCLHYAEFMKLLWADKII